VNALCTECGAKGGPGDAIWLGNPEYPEQGAAALAKVEQLRERAQRIPASRLAAALRDALDSLDHYEVLDVDPAASTRSIRDRLARPFGKGIPAVFATDVWRDAARAGFYVGGPTEAERDVFMERFRRSAAVLSDPVRRAQYDRELGYADDLAERLAGQRAHVAAQSTLSYGHSLVAVSLIDALFALWARSLAGILLAGFMLLLVWQSGRFELWAARAISSVRLRGSDDTLIRSALGALVVVMGIAGFVLALTA